MTVFIQGCPGSFTPLLRIWAAANSLRAHIETHCGLILRSISHISQDELKMWACCELSVNLQLTLWVCCELSMSLHSHNELAVSYSWDHLDELTMQWLQWAHCELVSCELTVLAQCDLTVMPHSEIFRRALFEYGVSSLLHWVSFQ